jgi:hypothetical protein
MARYVSTNEKDRDKRTTLLAITALASITPALAQPLPPQVQQEQARVHQEAVDQNTARHQGDQRQAQAEAANRAQAQSQLDRDRMANLRSHPDQGHIEFAAHEGDQGRGHDNGNLGNSGHNGDNGNHGDRNNGYQNGDNRTAGDYRGSYAYQGHSWQQARQWNYNRPDPRVGHYDPARYYRDGRYYQPRRLTRNDRIYRGYDGRFYCRRSDGTTGLIIGAIGGGVLGSSIAQGGSQTVGALLGGALGALIGQSIDRGNVTCR